MTAHTALFFGGVFLAKLLENLRIDGLALGPSARFDHDDFHHRTHLCFAGRPDSAMASRTSADNSSAESGAGK